MQFVCGNGSFTDPAARRDSGSRGCYRRGSQNAMSCNTTHCNAGAPHLIGSE